MKQLLGKGKLLITYLSVFSVLAASILSVFTGFSFSVRAAGDVWDGSTATAYASGTGTEIDPFIIENAAQLHKMVVDGGKYEGSVAYFKVADSVTEIYLNNYTAGDLTSLASATNNWKTDIANLNNNAASTSNFTGHFDGNGVKIYGLKFSGGANGGFIPIVEGSATIKNVHFIDSYVDIDGGGWHGAGVIVGAGARHSAMKESGCSLAISNCSVVNASVSSGSTTGGIMGHSCYVGVTMKSCLVKDVTLVNKSANTYPTGAFAPDNNSGGINVSDSLSLGITAQSSASATKVSFTNTYTDTAYANGAAVAGVTVLSAGTDINGEAARTAMPKLSWGEGWTTNSGSYPTPAKLVITVIAYASGTGTATDPFIIENAAQLHKMVEEYGKDKDGNPAYFKVKDGITEIIVNDATGFSAASPAVGTGWDNWMKNLTYDTNASKTGKTFVGNFNGNGATIFGLYAYSEGNNSVAFIPSAGPGAIVKNVTFDSAYVKNDARGAYEGAAVVIGRAYEASEALIDVSRVVVKNSYVSGAYAAAGIFGNLRNNTVKIDSCLVADCNIVNSTIASGTQYKGGAVADTWGKSYVSNSIIIGIHAETTNTPYGVTFSNVYTDSDYSWTNAAGTTTVDRAAGVTKIANADAAKGAAAKTNMPDLTWEKYGEAVWAVTDSYPVPTVSKAYYGVVGEPWSGKFADGYKSGSGTEADPYLIETAESLAFAIVRGNPDAYYELAADIYLNDVSTVEWYTSPDVKVWFDSNEVVGFTGKLNGANHTIYGLYVDAPANTSSALVPVFGSGAKVSNLTIADAYIKGAESTNVAAVAGLILDDASPSAIAAVDVLDSVQLLGGSNVGGIVGKVGASAVRINNSAFKGSINTANCISYGGIIGTSSGAAYVKASYAVNAYVVGNGLYSLTDVYTNVDHSAAPYKSEGIILLADEAMKGEEAKANMTALDWDNNVWQVNAGSYPTIVGQVLPSDGTPGEVWSGEKAAEYADGSGTADDPWQIATGEQLYKMYMEELGGTNDAPQHYFVLTEDIYLNDVESDFWDAKVGLNSWAGNDKVFRGTFDGAGHVIYGLYRNEPNSNIARLALFPAVSDGAVIMRTGLSHAYLVQDNTTSGNYFTAGFTSLVMDWDGSVVETDELADGEYNGKQVPRISECFVDHNSYIQGYYAGGIACGNNGGIIIENCYFTGTLNAASPKTTGGIMGDGWSAGCHIINCLSVPQSADRFCGGGKFTSATEANHDIGMKGNYGFSVYSQYGVNKLKTVADCFGQTNYDIMAMSDKNPDGMDFENIWMMVEDGTPVLRAFDINGKASTFSCRSLDAPKTTVILQTGTSAINYEPLVGAIYSELTLPTPTREGYKFTGWYVYSDYQCLYDYGYYPPRNLTLYAGWEQYGIIQDFENYPNSMWDLDTDHWTYNRPGAKGGYKVDYIHGGSKSMHRLATEGEQDCLLNYAETLTVGQTYTISFWVTTDTPNTAATLSLVHNTWPDYLEPTLGVEPMVTATGLKVGDWTQYTYSFTAKTQWISLRTTGNASLYFDDIIITPTGTLVENNNVINLNVGTTASGIAPNTGESVAPIVALVATIVACAVVMLVSKKASTEVIEK